MTTRSWFWRRHVLPALIGAVGSLAGGAAEVAAITIEDSVRATLASSPRVERTRADRRAVEQELAEARAGRLPSLDARLSAGPGYSRVSGGRRGADDGDRTSLHRLEAGLTLSQMLFDGFAVGSEVARQRARLGSAAGRVRETAELTALDAAQAHLEVLRRAELVRIAEDTVRAHEAIAERIRGLESGGRIDDSETRQTDARLAQAQGQLITAQGALGDARAAYLAVVGGPADALESPAGTPIAALPTGAEEAAAAAGDAGPTVAVARADLEAALAQGRGARAGYYPRVDLELSTIASDDTGGVDGSLVDASALVVMRYNLYRGGGDRARARSAISRSEEARAALADTRRDAEEEARVAWNALTTARGRSGSLRDEVRAQTLTRDAYASQFDLGNRNLLDLLDAENELFIARADLVSSGSSERYAGYRLLALTGRLLEALAIVPPQEATSVAPASSSVD